MFCQKCAAPNLDNAAYCRSCGTQIGPDLDPTKLNGYAIAKFIIGDAFVLPAVLLMALDSSVQTALWILLAIPGLLLYTWAVVDLVKAHALKREQKEISNPSTPPELAAPIPNDIPNDFAASRTPVSVIEHTTGKLR